MCGRYTLTSPVELNEALGAILAAPVAPDAFAPRYNVAPTQPAPVVTNRGRTVEALRWGLVPHWAKDLAIGARMINARAEGLSDKAAFKDAFARRRCLVPADGFYEWRAAGKRKEPLWIRREPRAVFCFAGLWARWHPPDGGEPIATFTIITTTPSDAVAPYHDRMPVILEPADWERWLCPDPLPPEALLDLLAPSRARLAVVPVSTAANSVANDGPECLAPPEQPSLF